MGLTIWAEHGAGHRSSHFFARIAKSLGRHAPSTCYVVPNAGAKRRAESLCLEQGPRIFFGDRILTLSAWVEGLAKVQRPVLTNAQRHPIIHTLLKTIPLDYFQTSAATATCVLIARGITSAFLAGLSPVQLHHLARDYGQEREQDLGRIFEVYCNQLEKDRRVDPAQIPGLAIDAIQNDIPLTARRMIIETGMSPIPTIWKILRALVAHPTPPDLHIIVPDYHRSRAESELGVIAQEIGPDEWIAAPESPVSTSASATLTPTPPTSAPLRLYRAPHLTAEYRWMAQQIKTPQTGVLMLDPDPSLWLEVCMAEGILPETALPLPLAASPVSAPWFDTSTWHHAPASAPLRDWMLWWRNRLYPESKIQCLRQQIFRDDFACRMLQDIAAWKSLWLHTAANIPAAQELTSIDLRTLVNPLLQDTASIDPETLPYQPVSLLSHLGDPIPDLLVLDAAQSNLPGNAGASPFFKSSTVLPQDPNARILHDAFPSAETVLQLQIAAWQRLACCASKITAGYAVASDYLGEQFPSLLLDVALQDIPISHATSTQPIPRDTPETLLSDDDTISHLRRHMRAHTFSITELEDFAACPFRHFARYILGINVPDEESPDIPPKHEGRIIHRLLECFYRHPHVELLGMSAEARADSARDILREILAHEVKTITPLRQIQINRLLQSATAAVLLDLATRDRLGNDALQPAHLEWAFGKKEVPPLTLQAPNADPVDICGKVDRIDVNLTTRQLLLIDYKTGTTGSIIGDIRKGTHLQIPIYLLAARSVFVDFVILGGLLFDLKLMQRCHGMARRSAAEFLGIARRLKSLTNEETWDELLQTASTHAVQYAQQIRGGKFSIGRHTCEYCDWKGLLPWEK